MGRPGYLQRWAYDAAPGACVQPPDGVAGEGFETEFRPPAQWFNWCFANWADWVNFLRGANHEHWTRTAWGTSPSTFDVNMPLFLAVDTETADATGAAFRYVIAGQETNTPNTAALRVSKRGNEWTRRTNVTATASALPVALAYVPNPAASGVWLLGCDDASINYCTVDAGGGTGPVGSGSGNWSVSSTPGGMTDVVAFAVRENKIFALTIDGGVQSTDQGLTWTAYAGTSGTSRSGNGSDACWTGNAFLFITTDGQVYKSATVGGAFAYVTDLGGTATWRFATDGAGGVLAYRVNDGSTLDIFWSTDDGGTWETITPTSGFNRIQRVRHHDGTWLACSTVAPFLWASNDRGGWRKLRMPVGSDAALYDIAWDGGAWICAGNGYALQCPRGHDPGDADGSWSPASGAAPLVDAGYLRGNEVSATAPTNGQVLTWNNTGGHWEPTTISASSPTTTRGDLIRRGASADERLPAATANTFVGGDGTDVMTRTATQVRASLGAREALPDTGWSDVTSGTGAVSHSSGVHTLSIPTGSGAETLYPAPSTPECPALELIARLDVSTGVPGSTWWGAIELRSPDGADALIAQVTEAGVVQAWRTGTGTPLASTGSGVFSLTSGEAWLRLVVTPYYAAVFYGTGSGSTPPTSWTKVHQVETDAAQHARGAMTRVGLRVGRTGGSGTFTTEFRNVQARVLGISP